MKEKKEICDICLVVIDIETLWVGFDCAGFGGAGLHVRAQQEDQIPKGYI